MRRNGTSVAIALLALCGALAAGCKNSRPDRGTVTCTPGTRIEVACGTGCGLGSCTGDPVLEICAGDVTCSTGDLGSNDDGCGSSLCPGLTVTCPPGGLITVAPRGYSSSRSYTCNWDTRVLTSSGLTEAGDAGAP
jgi:hypothetical protein